MIKRKIKKKRRNPKNFSKDKYFELLAIAYVEGKPNLLSDAIIYGNQGLKCDDCGWDYYICRCEGGREIKLHSPSGQYYQEPCEECNLNTCLCELNLPKEWTTKGKEYEWWPEIKPSVKKKVQKKILEIISNLNINDQNYFQEKVKHINKLYFG